MGITTRAGVAALSLTAGLALTACSSGSSNSSASTASTPTTASGGTASAAASSPTASPAGSSSAAASSSSGSAGSSAAGDCQPTNLRFALGSVLGSSQNPKVGQGQYEQVIDLTNEGSSACTMTGYPGVNLVGAANGEKNYEWPLERSTESYSAVTVEPGSTAHFGIVYPPWGSGTAGQQIAVTSIIVTPPNDYSHGQLNWSKTLLLQDAATSPGTWLMPVANGS